MSRRRKKPILPTRDERGRFITKSKTKPKAKPQKKKARIPDASSPRVVSDPRRGERHARPVATKVAKAKKGVKKVARKAAPKFTEAQWLAKVNRQIVREQRARARKIAMAVEKKRAADEKADREREVAKEKARVEREAREERERVARAKELEKAERAEVKHVLLKSRLWTSNYRAGVSAYRMTPAQRKLALETEGDAGLLRDLGRDSEQIDVDIDGTEFNPFWYHD